MKDFPKKGDVITVIVGMGAPFPPVGSMVVVTRVSKDGHIFWKGPQNSSYYLLRNEVELADIRELL